MALLEWRHDTGGELGNETSSHPSFRLLSNGFGMDNPDNRYLGAPVTPNREYVIRGRMAPLSYLSFASQSQNYSRTDSITGGGSHLEIECVDVDDPPPPLSPTRIADRLAMVALFTTGASQWFREWVSPWIRRPNTFELADPSEQQLVGGDPNILCQSGYWTLGSDEALLVELTPPTCDYWNIQLANVWAEALDTRRQVWRNNVSARCEPDGSARLVIAHRDPGHPNWLDTSGHRHGLMHIRFVHSDGSPLAVTRVVSIDDVPAGPPPG